MNQVLVNKNVNNNDRYYPEGKIENQDEVPMLFNKGGT